MNPFLLLKLWWLRWRNASLLRRLMPLRRERKRNRYLTSSRRAVQSLRVHRIALYGQPGKRLENA
ncbi:MAG: hypothetical protein SFY81_04880 [Verrucomicrobiota bacterium]|nr:hypothetical protein [Verrucomicrobiota bacterium]